MKSLLLAIGLLSVLMGRAAAADDDPQTNLANIILEKSGAQLVRNDLVSPVRVTTDKVGTLFVCFNQSLEYLHLIPITPDIFKKGENAVLLLCQKSGEFEIMGDYI